MYDPVKLSTPQATGSFLSVLSPIYVALRQEMGHVRRKRDHMRNPWLISIYDAWFINI